MRWRGRGYVTALDKTGESALRSCCQLLQRLTANRPGNSRVSQPYPPAQGGKDGKDVDGTNRSGKHEHGLVRLHKESMKLMP
jgi:hypothetical protein